jgi:hypothetical protein
MLFSVLSNNVLGKTFCDSSRIRYGEILLLEIKFKMSCSPKVLALHIEALRLSKVGSNRRQVINQRTDSYVIHTRSYRTSDHKITPRHFAAESKLYYKYTIYRQLYKQPPWLSTQDSCLFIPPTNCYCYLQVRRYVLHMSRLILVAHNSHHYRSKSNTRPVL